MTKIISSLMELQFFFSGKIPRKQLFNSDCLFYITNTISKKLDSVNFLNVEEFYVENKQGERDKFSQHSSIIWLVWL